MVLLHGFPQSSASWRRVTPRPTAAGLRVLAPDQRGYVASARPSEIAAYRLRELVGDVLALIDHARSAGAHVVGHDFGGVVAWALAAAHGDRVSGITVLSAPHPKAFLAGLLTPSQAARSGYLALLRAPRLPEALFGVRRGAVLRAALRRADLPSEFADEYLGRLLDDGASAGALAYYRALRLRELAAVGAPSVPARFLVGARDRGLAPGVVRATALHARAPATLLPGAGHWLPEAFPGGVAEHVLTGTGIRGPSGRPRLQSRP